MVNKEELTKKLTVLNTQFASATDAKKNNLREQAYWLTQALESNDPDAVLRRAFDFWEHSNGKTGLVPFELSDKAPSTTTPSLSDTMDSDITLWGKLDRVFQSGEELDDRQVSDIFNRLPPITQTHFIDTVMNYILADETTAENDFTALLKNEERLLDLVEKTKQTVKVKDELIQRVTKKLTDWLRYHQTEPATEAVLEDVLFGRESAKALSDESAIDTLQPYEKFIRDWLRMSTTQYMNIRHVLIEQLLAAVPPDPAQLALVTKSAVRQDLLDVPEPEFSLRVRTAAIIRGYTFSKDLRRLTIRQFFRAIVEEK
ncbi:MAG: hypothetical protein G01um101470_254 [Parcubacteria group bacterium Gr01-1014_70]|nr:MAG: hypothetical protein G01um101470_254 [Parcubacteria group bacterium Gr01-1014_70]